MFRIQLHATRQFADLYLTTFPIQTDEVGYSFICRIAGHLLPQRGSDDFATWPTLSAHSLLPYLEIRSDGVFTQWSDRRKPTSLSYHHGFLLDRPSEDGPALCFECSDGAQELEYWRHGKRHRDPAEGPALLKIHGEEDGNRREEYYIDGELHRDDGPAGVIIDNGIAISETWFRHGKPHRVGAPALIHRNSHGTVTLAQTWRDGIHLETITDVFGTDHVS